MRLPNGYGTVYNISGGKKLRNPWVAKRFAGWKVDDVKLKRTPIYKTVGYFKTRKEALEALSKANGEAISSTGKKFEDVYLEWSEQKFKTLSLSRVRNYKAVYPYFSDLYKKIFASLSTYDYERVIREDNVPRTSRQDCLILLHQLYDYAIKHDIVEKDYSKMVDFHIDKKTRIKREVFTDGEVSALWGENDRLSKIILFSLYTGFRSAEVCDLKIKDCHPDEGYVTGGMKTEAGKNRVVPIVDAIRPVFDEYYADAIAKNRATLFDMRKHNYQVKFSEKFPGRATHDTRHSFATWSMMSGIDPTITKMVMGHKANDITIDIYTHIPAEKIVEEYKKFHTF